MSQDLTPESPELTDVENGAPATPDIRHWRALDVERRDWTGLHPWGANE